MEIAVIGGGGTIGATTGYTLARLRPDADVVLIDVDEGLAWAQATDIDHAAAHVAHPIGRHVLPWAPDEQDGSVRSLGTDAADECDPDVVVVTASAPRPDSAAVRGGRVRYLDMNNEVMDDVARQLSAFDPVPTLVVTNPLDRMTYRIWDRTGWDRRHILGYSLSETARAADYLARAHDARHADVSCPIMGEHGEHIVPLFSRTTVRGDPVPFTPEDRSALLDYVRDVPYDVIAERGTHETSRWVTGYGVAAIVETLLRGGLDEPICLSTPLDGEYGYEDVCLGVPMTLSAEGVGEILTWELADHERARLDAAAAAVSADL